MATGWTFGTIKDEVLGKVKNGLSRDCEGDLYRIFRLNPNYPWVNRSSLEGEIRKSTDVFDLEEAARVVIHPSIYYDTCNERYYIYG